MSMGVMPDIQIIQATDISNCDYIFCENNQCRKTSLSNSNRICTGIKIAKVCAQSLQKKIINVQ